MGKKLFILVICTTFILLIYFCLADVSKYIICASFIALAGFHYSFWVRHCVCLTSVVAFVLIAPYIKFYPFITVSLCLLFMSIIPLPYYFRNKLKKRKEKYYAISKNLKVKHSCILSSYKESFQVRRRYESFVERIVQNYIIGNKLLKCSSKEIFVQNILSFLKEKKIINGAAIFELTNSNWNILGAFGSISNKNLIPKICYIKDIGRYYEKTLLSKDEDDVENTSKIYLPIVNANELLGAVIVSVQVGELENFIEETSFFIPQISVSLKRLKLFDYINERSRVDGLTGLYTKHYFLQRLEVEMSRQKRYGKGFYILMIDLDFFKCLNDKYGHLFGDKIIHKVAKSIRSSIRRGDLAGRYGGEEFIVFLPTISQKIVRNTAETIRQAVANLEFESNGEKIKVTLSTGVSSNSKKSKNVENIIANADSALYEAKKTGRNKVISYDSM